MDIETQIHHIDVAMAFKRKKIAEIQREYQVLFDARKDLEKGIDVFHGNDLRCIVANAVMQKHKRGEI